MNKVTDLEKAIEKVKDGDVLMVGGFLKGGIPDTLLGGIMDKGLKELTIISNDAGTKENIPYQMIERGMIAHVKSSYIGANPLVGEMLMNDESSVELVPQGTLAERIRAGGAGLGGILTPVGVGTIVEKENKVRVNNKYYLLERPLRGNVALLHATKADKSGNCFMKGTIKNFNALMAAAADYVVVEAEEVVETGTIGPEDITVTGILVDSVVPLEAK